MKTFAILLTSLMVTAASSAIAQNNSDTCHGAMIPCLDMCTQRPSKALQDSCAKTCEINANACYSQLYGTPSRSATPAALSAATVSPPPATATSLPR